MNGIKAIAQIRAQQDVYLVLKNMKQKIIGQPHDELLIKTDSRYKKYKANEDRKNLKNGLLFRKHFGETGSVKYYQILFLNNSLTNFSAACTENMEKTQDVPKYWLLTYKNFTSQKWRNQSGSGS